MCGILGYVGESPSLTAERFRAGLDLIAHRGPDDHGIEICDAAPHGRVFLGHRRLSILDLSELGHQPMVSPRSGSWIVYNGEVYNFEFIREELIALGHTFRSNCDTEVLLAAYDQWGDECVKRFNGMFALAIYDSDARQVFLARDRVGIKPLYYLNDGNQFGFASELTALAGLGVIETALRADAVPDYFALGYLARELTALKNYFKLRPGHTLRYDLTRRTMHIAQYWNALDAYAAPAWTDGENALAERLEELLSDAVRMRLIADVPLGAFLSGGIDSSLTVSLLSRASSTRVKTFTIGFTEPEKDEAPFARRIAEHLGTEHHELYVSAKGLEEVLVQTASNYDEPFADYSSVPTSVLSRMTRQHVTVALSGDGGDEQYFGYTRYLRAGTYSRLARLPLPIRGGMAAVLRRLPGYRPGVWAYVLDSPDAARSYARQVTNRVPDLVYGSHDGLISDQTAMEVGDRLGTRDWRKLVSAIDLLNYLPEDLLTKVDRASMAYALEVRVPLLDYRFVEFSARVPHELKYRNKTTKYLMRKVLARYIPPSLWERPKSGFAMPLTTWFRNELRPWVMDELTSNWDWTFDLINRPLALKLIDGHMQGRMDCAPLIWAMISWKHWTRRIGLLR